MTLTLARRQTAAILVALLLAFGMAAVSSGTVPVPGVTHTAAAHADENWDWVPCVGGMSGTWGQLGLIGLQWQMDRDPELAFYTLQFFVWANTFTVSAYTCLDYVNSNLSPSIQGAYCYPVEYSQGGDLFVGDSSPQGMNDGYTCDWNSSPHQAGGYRT
jgi:hypothetical protein